MELSRVIYPKVTSCADDGSAHVVEHKAWCHRDGQVLWELRRPLQAILKQRQDLQLNKLLKQHYGEWVSAATVCGGGDQDLILSRRSANVRSMGADQRVHSEFSATTIGVLGILLHVAFMRKRSDERSIAKAVLSGFFMVMAEPAEMSRIRVGNMIARFAWMCPLRVEAANDAVCSHVDRLKALCNAPPCAGLHPDATNLLLQVFITAHYCEAAKALLQAWVRRMRASIDKNAFDDPRHNDDPQKCMLLEGRSQRLRIDEDLKRKWVEDLPRSGRVRSMTTAVMCDGVYSGSTGNARKCQDDFLACYMVAGWEQGELARGVVALTSDGKRLGTPAVDTNTYSCWLAEQDLAFWLPNQVPRKLADANIM